MAWKFATSLFPRAAEAAGGGASQVNAGTPTRPVTDTAIEAGRLGCDEHAPTGTTKVSDVLLRRVNEAAMVPTTTATPLEAIVWPGALRVTVVPSVPWLGVRVTGPGAADVKKKPGSPIVAGLVTTVHRPANGDTLGVTNVSEVPSGDSVVGLTVYDVALQVIDTVVFTV
jgi:hypothetical protein